MMYKLFVVSIFCLFCYSYSLEFSKESDDELCDGYFHGSSWPKMKGISTINTVKLCQTQRKKNLSVTLNSSEMPFYATLFNTYHRTPVYSANRVLLAANKTILPRPNSTYWNRVAMGLCRNTIPKSTIYSDVAFVSEKTLDSCNQLQAIDKDYYENDLNFDRGHLTPNHINCRNKEKQLSTFTLTNVAPQYADFNRHSWRIFECVTEYMIIQLVPNEPVYILTGVYGSALDESGKDIWLYGHTDKKRVKAPGYYWKAVCYPGNSLLKKKPWAYAIIQENVNKRIDPKFQDYMTLKDFAQKLFDDPPFGPDCMNAGFGDFATVFSDWDHYINTYCYEPWMKDENIV